MNNNYRIDIRGSIADATSEMSKDLIGMLVVAIILGFAFAPCFSPFFRDYLVNKYDMYNNIHLVETINGKMLKINLILWLISFLSWMIITGLYIVYNV